MLVPFKTTASRCRMYAAIACAALLSCSAHAAVNSQSRLQAFAKLPDWSGIWVASGSTKTFDPSGKPPPYNDEWLAKYKAAQKDKKRRDTLEDLCVAGMPRLSVSNYPFMIMITPEETLIHYSHRELRHVWTDGRDHPPIDEQWPYAWGDSTGKWDGERLLIDTVSLKPELWIDNTGATLSSQAQIIERISMEKKNELKNEITVNDPTSLSRPWTITRTYKRSTMDDLPEELCKRSQEDAPVVNKPSNKR